MHQHGYSPAALDLIVSANGMLKSGPAAVRALEKLAGISLSESHLQTLTQTIGQELAAERDARAARHARGELEPEVSEPPSLASVYVDGGRVLTRAAEQTRGVHEQQWKEVKAACLLTMSSTPSAVDPHPDLPTCFTDAPYVDQMVREIKSLRSRTTDSAESAAETGLAAEPANSAATGESAATKPVSTESVASESVATKPISAESIAGESASTKPVSSESIAGESAPTKPVSSKSTATKSVSTKSAATAAPPKSAASRWQPKRLVRTCIATLGGIVVFGPLVAAEAQRRGFFQALRRAFVGDGQAWNWTLHARHFETFTPILDFVHLLTYLYEVSRAMVAEDAAWAQYLRVATACWQGRGSEVLQELRTWQAANPLPEEALPETDPRMIVAKAATYIEHNLGRMNYPEYRRQGLPIVSAMVESMIKELNYRVKGSEKFWNRPTGIEPMLQVRAAVLCDDADRLSEWILNRPGSAFYRPSTNARHCQQHAENTAISA